MALSATSNMFLNISREGDSTPLLRQKEMKDNQKEINFNMSLDEILLIYLTAF